MTFLASFFILSFFVIGRELYANRLYRGWQLSALNHPVHYADVPLMAVSSVKQMREFDAAVCKYMHKICLSTNDAQIVRVASGAKGEGKASIARALAVYHQKMGKTVLLIDGDLTNRSSTTGFGFKDRPGLTDYIAGNKGIKDIIVDDPMYHISFLPAGSRVNADLKSLNLKPLRDLFTVLTKDYEKIIFIDEPSASDHLLISDMLPQHGDIMVVGSGEHSIYEIDHFAELYEFMKDKSTLKGIVVNKIIA
jgi:MinD-like ATPase involved in chromosome partitioning or flagellar assembly